MKTKWNNLHRHVGRTANTAKKFVDHNFPEPIAAGYDSNNCLPGRRRKISSFAFVININKLKELPMCLLRLVTPPIMFSALIFLAGCAAPSNQTVLDVSSMLKANAASKSGRSPSGSDFDETVWGGLARAANTRAIKERSSSSTLPTPLANSPLITKLIAANRGAVETASGRSLDGQTTAPKRVKFTSSDFKDFIKNTIPAVGINAWMHSQSTGSRAMDETSGNSIEKYLITYYQGNFIDRAGNAISKPSIQNGNIGDTSIVGFATVILDAINDAFYSVPVFYELKDNKQSWLTPTGKEPTFATLSKDVTQTNNSAANNFGYDPAKVVLVTTNAGPGLPDITEVSAIQFLSGVASDQSKAISGLVFKAFGGASVEFVIGGKLSIGDNKTLSDLVDTFFSESSYRTTEALTYSYFKSHSEEDSGDGLKKLLDTLQELNTLYADYKGTNSLSSSANNK